MRQITKRAFQAFKMNKNFKLDNTKVVSDHHSTNMYLHGNEIARKCHDTGLVEITTAGWNTPTTKERLKPFACVHTVNFGLHLDGLLWNGDWTVLGLASDLD